MRKKMLTVLLALAMVVAMMPVMTGVAAARAAVPEPYQVLATGAAVGTNIFVNAQIYEELKSGAVQVDEETGKAEIKALDTAIINASKFKKINDLTVKTLAGTMHLDAAALDLMKAALGEKKTVSEVKISADIKSATLRSVRVELNASVKNRKFSDFSGAPVEFTVAVPSKLKDKEVQAIYIGRFGKVELADGTLNDNGTYTMSLDHFSSYALVSKELADKLVKADTKLTAEEVADVLNSLDLACEAVNDNGKVKVSANVNDETLKAVTKSGYNVEYKFYRSTKSNQKYNLLSAEKKGNYEFDNDAAKTYYYKFKIVVTDKENAEVATTELKNCSYSKIEVVA